MDLDAFRVGLAVRGDPGPSRRSARRTLTCLIAITAAFAPTLGACAGVGPHTADPTTPPVASASPIASAPPSLLERSPSPLAPAEQAFADAWLEIVAAFDSEVTDVLIANPLSEWDLVGARLIDTIDRTRQALASLQPPRSLGAEARALESAMQAALTRLQAIEPHGPRTEQATAYIDALDGWVAEVRPHAEAIRDALGLAPLPSGDLQL